MPLPVRRVALLGVGLIGGSLGLALRRYAPELEVVGLDEPDVLDVALRRGAISHRAADVASAVAAADVVVLAAPIRANMALMRAAAAHLAADAVVTDVGSVKAPMAQQAAGVLPEGVLFAGGHPMTGSERRGILHADALLFENAVYVVCPPDRGAEDDPRFRALVALIEKTGARVLTMSADRHDEAAAAVSHLPQLLSVALVGQLGDLADDGTSRHLAAGGFRDMTRIASSPYGVWRDILQANHGPILDAMARFAARFERLRGRLADDDLEALGDAFAEAADTRATVPARSKGFLHPLADVFVYTPDEPGALHRITGALADGGVNIKDIELLKIREGTGGTFRLGVDGDRDAERAVEVLGAAGFQAYRL
jgi:prephenate dehydrogenase